MTYFKTLNSVKTELEESSLFSDVHVNETGVTARYKGFNITFTECGDNSILATLDFLSPPIKEDAEPYAYIAFVNAVLKLNVAVSFSFNIEGNNIVAEAVVTNSAERTAHKLYVVSKIYGEDLRTLSLGKIPDGVMQTRVSDISKERIGGLIDLIDDEDRNIGGYLESILNEDFFEKNSSDCNDDDLDDDDLDDDDSDDDSNDDLDKNFEDNPSEKLKNPIKSECSDLRRSYIRGDGSSPKEFLKNLEKLAEEDLCDDDEDQDDIPF